MIGIQIRKRMEGTAWGKEEERKREQNYKFQEFPADRNVQHDPHDDDDDDADRASSSSSSSLASDVSATDSFFTLFRSTLQPDLL